MSPFYACNGDGDPAHGGEVRWAFVAGNRAEGVKSRSTYILETTTLSTPDHVFDDGVRV